jgi:H+/Cl- antiporter ClcA
MELTAIFIVGFIVLGVYKLFELFVKKRERLMLIEKLVSLPSSTEVPEPIRLPKILFEKQDYGSWPLRISLLLIGIGLGCLSSVIIQLNYAKKMRISNCFRLRIT